MSKVSVKLKGCGASRVLAPKLANLLVSKGKADYCEENETKTKPKTKVKKSK